MTEWIYDAAAGRCRKVGGGQAMTRRKTDGERIAEKVWSRMYAHLRHVGNPMSWEGDLARDIDRLLRKRMSEAWKEGWSAASWYNKHECDNPYRGRKKK